MNQRLTLGIEPPRFELAFRWNGWRRKVSLALAPTLAFCLLLAVPCAPLSAGSGSELGLAEAARPELENRLALCRTQQKYFHRVGKQKEEAEILETMAGIYQRLGRWHQAKATYKRALSLFVDQGKEKHAAAIRVKLVSSLSYLDEHDEAMQMACQAMSFYEAWGDQVGRTRALLKLARLHCSAEAPEKARSCFYQAWNLCESLQQPSLTVLALETLGTLYYWEGQFQEALTVFQLIQRLPEAEFDIIRELYVLNMVGNSFKELGEPLSAIESFRNAIVIHENVGLGDLGVYAFNLAALYSLFGEKQRALEYAEKSRQALLAAGAPPNGDASVNWLLGRIHQSSGDHPQATHFFKKALVVFQRIGNPRGVARTLAAMGDGALAGGDPRSALDYLHQALQINREAGNGQRTASCLKSLAMCYFRLSRFQEARCFLEEALSMQRGLGLRVEMAETHYHLGRFYLRRGSIAAATYQCLEALALNEKLGNQHGEALSLHLLARILRARGRPLISLAVSEDALEKVESLRVKIMERQMRISYFDTVHEVFEFHQDLLMQMAGSEEREGYLTRALQVSERARARGFLDLLQDARHNPDNPEIQGLVVRQNQIRGQLNRKELFRMGQVQKGLDKESLSALDMAVEELLTEFRRIDGRIHEIQVRGIGIGKTQPLSLAEIRQKVLDEDTVLLEYSLGEKRGFLWMVTLETLAGFELPGRSEIESRVHKILELLTARGTKKAFETPLEKEARVRRADAELRSTMAELSWILLGPVYGRLHSKRLFIVADGALRLLPLGVLPLPEPDGKGFAAPLLSRFEIAGAPSASIQALLKQARMGCKSAPKTLAVFADPVFASDDSRFSGSHGRKMAQVNREDNIDVDSFVRDSIGILNRLPFTRREARQLSRLLPRDQVYEALDFKASREQLLDIDLQQYRVIHFATHGMISDTYPELSGLVLSLFDAEGRPRDGILRQHDVFNLNLNADLVVLSGCRTGLGKNSNGEGLIGLTRSFMYAGATRVLASHWMVQDEATAELMIRFYRHLLIDRQHPGHALRSAQLSMWRDSRWRAPYFWGAFVLQGPWE